MQLTGKVFVVTGAQSGLGAATVAELMSHGATVVGVDRVMGQSGGEGGYFVQADVCSEAECQSVFTTALNRFGHVHGLINCAGVAPASKVLGRDGVHSLEAFSRTVQINLVGSFNMLRLAADAMQRNPAEDTGERGVIINTASVAAYDGQIGQAAYAASKGGVVAMTLPLARELARYGIRVMTVAPGIMETPMLTGMPQEVQDALGQMVPFPSRLGRPAEFAALARHIIENPYLNGEVIRLDGAIRMAPK